MESFGAEDAPLVVLVGGTTMLSWPDGLCERLAAGGRRVARYDLGTAGPVQEANQLGMVFSRLDCAPRWRERLGGITVPALG